jgi:hypothetical protein
MQLDISADEAEVLTEVLERALGDVREEIYKAEVADYKIGLKHREAAIVHMLERLHSRPGVT